MQLRALVAIAALTASTAYPQNAAPEVKLELRCASPCTFHQGESIWVELAFTAAVPNNYKVLTNYTERYMAREEFTVSPAAGASDPYLPYSRLLEPSAGSFGFREEPLSETPVVLRFNLNEWVRFDQPGEYNVSVVSPRVAVRPKSNEVILSILPADPGWQQADLTRIRGVLDADPPRWFDETHVREDAVIALSDLGTEDAAIEMARRLPGDERAFRSYQSGLVRSPNRAAGVREMERMLQDPDVPISSTFLSVMANGSIDPVRDLGQMGRQSQANYTSFQQRLVEALSFKRGAARAVSADTVLLIRGLSEDDRKRAVAALVENFADLPAGHYLSTPVFTREQQLSIYRILFERGDMGEGTLAAGSALGRWYEMDPDGARAAIITELQRPKPRFGVRFLGILPDKSLPQVESALAQHLVADTSLKTEADVDSQVNLAELLRRYATPAVLPAVLPFFNGPMVCEAENAVLAYVLKADPEIARPLIQRALSRPRPKSCPLIFGIGLDGNPFLEELAVNRINDSSQRVALDAAWYLEHHGSAAAEPYLLARYEALARNTNPSPDELNLALALVGMLAQGQAWFYDAAKLRSLADRAPAGPIRDGWEEQLKPWNTGVLFVSSDTNTPRTYHVAQYNFLTLDELKDKLAQFSSGTTFHWKEQLPTDPDPAFRDLAEWATTKGISIQQ